MGRPADSSALQLPELRIPWSRIVELAQEIDRKHSRGDSIDAELGPQLARAILQFQAQLVAGMLPSV
jgi:hypothetical protein